MRKQDEDLNVKPEALLWLDFETTGTEWISTSTS